MVKPCIKIDPRTFNNRIIIQTITQSADGQGGFEDSWANTYTVWASVQPLREREEIAAMQVESPTVYRIQCRYLSGITPKNRILFNSDQLNITGVLNVWERNAFLEITAIAGKAT